MQRVATCSMQRVATPRNITSTSHRTAQARARLGADVRESRRRCGWGLTHHILCRRARAPSASCTCKRRCPQGTLTVLLRYEQMARIKNPVCVCACVCVCARARARACVCVRSWARKSERVRAGVRAGVHAQSCACVRAGFVMGLDGPEWSGALGWRVGEHAGRTEAPRVWGTVPKEVALYPGCFIWLV
jgi:hypothetical protein